MRIRRGRPIEEDTIFHLYSMIEVNHSGCSYEAVEDGEVDLMDPVPLSARVHGAKGADRSAVGPCGQIELHDLVELTSGIPYPGDQAAPSFNRLFEEAEASVDSPDAFTTVELANRIGREPLSFQSGERWMYGASADVLGAVVEVVDGMRFGEYLRREIFEPLGMEDTGFFVPEEKQRRLAVIHPDSCRTVRRFRTAAGTLRSGNARRAPAFGVRRSGTVFHR
ncbi:MAG: serine hydrolase domain-containing protein [Oscillospiraceae bacterium]